MLKLALIGVIIGLLLFASTEIYKAGMKAQAGIEAQARLDLQETQAEQVKIIYKEKVKIDVRYRDKIKTIYQLKDATGCLDTKLGDAGLLPSPSDN